MKVTLVSVFVALAVATGFGFRSVESTESWTAAAVHVAGAAGEPVALLLSGGFLLGLAGAVKRFTV